MLAVAVWLAWMFNGPAVGAVSPPDRGPGGSRSELTLQGTIRSVIRVEASRRVVVAENVEIGPGGLLDLGPGVVVSFARGRGLFVRGGGLSARGTAAAPIIFTSGEPRPQAGDWLGIVFDWTGLSPQQQPPPMPSALEHVVLEYAGHPWSKEGGVEGAAGLSLVGYVRRREKTMKTGVVSIWECEVRENANRGLDVRTDVDVRFEALRFGRNGGISARIDIDFGDRLGSTPSEAVELTGNLRRPMTLPRLPQPYIIADSLSVGSHSNAPLAVLTVPAKSTIAFKRRATLKVGGYFKGRLVAHGVTFTSAENPPAAGDWGGVDFWVQASGDLVDDVFEYAGEEGSPAVSVGRPDNMKIQRIIFRKNGGPAIRTSGSCTRWHAPALGNTSEGQPLCVVGR